MHRINEHNNTHNERHMINKRTQNDTLFKRAERRKKKKIKLKRQEYEKSKETNYRTNEQ